MDDKKQNIEISIIVPCYNVEKYVERCIKSIIAQTFSEFELILVNDGSKDNTLEVLKQYEKMDGRLIVIDKINGGASSARNLGIEKARGNYIMFVDGDDYIDSQMLYVMHDEMLKNGADIVRCSRCDVYNNYSSFFYRQGLFEAKKVIEKPEFRLIYKDFLSRTKLSSMCMTLIKRKILTDNNLRFDESLTVNEDEVLSMQICTYANKFVYIPDGFYYYVKHNNSLSTSGVNLKARINSRRKHMSILEEYIKMWNLPESNEMYIEKTAFECIHTAIQTAAKNDIVKNSKRLIIYKSIFEDALFSDAISKSKGKIMKWPEKIVLFLVKHKCFLISFWYSLLLNFLFTNIYPKIKKLGKGGKA